MKYAQIYIILKNNGIPKKAKEQTDTLLMV